MPTKPKKPCSYPGCSKLTNGRYCEERQKIILKGDTECIEKYMIMKSLARTMLNNHLINKDEFTKINIFISKKYYINIGSVYRQNDLI